MTDPTIPIDPGEPLESGATFAGHRIESMIGSGGMGVVYRVLNMMLERERALKLIAPQFSADQRFRRRFQREVRLAAQVEHPNVIPVHDAGEAGQRRGAGRARAALGRGRRRRRGRIIWLPSPSRRW